MGPQRIDVCVCVCVVDAAARVFSAADESSDHLEPASLPACLQPPRMRPGPERELPRASAAAGSEWGRERYRDREDIIYRNLAGAG